MHVSVTKTCLYVSNYKVLIIKKSVSTRVLAFHFILHSMIRSFWRGFMVRRSCVTQLVEVFVLIDSQLDRGEIQVHIVYLDNFKAFDQVTHRKILSVMQK